MKKNRVTLLEILIAVGMLSLLAVIVTSQFTRPTDTSVKATIIPAQPKLQEEAMLCYSMRDRWDNWAVQFKDVGLDGDLDQVYCRRHSGKAGFTVDPNGAISVDGSIYPYSPDWSVWLERFEEVHKEFVTGAKPD